MSTTSDFPTGLTFVDPNESDAQFRVVLWAAPGQGKSVAAATAPDPILVLSGDRPNAYRFARTHPLSPAKGKDIREVRFRDANTLTQVLEYLKGTDEVRTVVIDPFGQIYDKLGEQFVRGDGEINYQTLNKWVKRFLVAIREFGVNLVIVAHEKVNDGKGGDGKLYPALGGPALINYVLGESDIVAHVERRQSDHGTEYVGQLTPRGNLVCKESTGFLGDTRRLDLAEWFEAATAADGGPVPWDDTPAPAAAEKPAKKAKPEPAYDALAAARLEKAFQASGMSVDVLRGLMEQVGVEQGPYNPFSMFKRLAPVQSDRLEALISDWVDEQDAKADATTPAELPV